MLETAHKLAVRAGAKKVAALLDGSYSPEEDNSSEAQKKIAAGGMNLHQAVRQNDETAVRALLDMGEDINAISEDETFEGLSPLAVACQTCNVAMASLLLECLTATWTKTGKLIRCIITKGRHLMGRTRRKLSSEGKLKMVMAVIQDGKAVSDVAQENNVHPNMILNWKKEFLENAAMIFDRHRPDITEKAQRRKIEELETKLKKKDEVIAEIAEENMMIKKTFGGRS